LCFGGVSSTIPSSVAEINQLADDFLASVRGRGLSPKTLREYRFPLNEVLLPYCRRHSIAEVEELTRAALDQLSAQLLEEGGKSGRSLSRHTIASYLRSINVFLSWAEAEGESVAGRAKAPKSERDKLIVRLLSDTGIRVGELVRLTLNDQTFRPWSFDRGEEVAPTSVHARSP
jgi:site-specific recombinase XerD